jgi:squalene cyclase
MVTSSVNEQKRTGGGHVGVTGLAGIAFLAAGQFPGRGEYGRTVERAIDYVLSQVKEDGYITDNGSRMYSHAFATLFLGEVYGMTRRSDVREKLQMSIDLIVRSQNKKGSWRYLPFAPDSDMSVTVCQVMALRAAQNTGIRVPKSTIDAAIEYVKASKIQSGNNKGGFTYQDRPAFQTRTSFSLTAAGVATLHNAAVYTDEDIQEGLEYLLSRLDQHVYYRNHYFYFYGHYYATQAMFIAGSPYWERYYPVVRDQLISYQRSDGSWASNVGETFSTAMATIILQIPQRFLPIFQR